MLPILVKESSRGRVLLEVIPSKRGLRSVLVRPIDDAGCGEGGVAWHSFEADGRTLAEAIVAATGIPDGEAESLAATVEAWDARTYEPGREIRVLTFLTPIFMLVLFPLSLLWILVWVILQLI